MRNLGLEKIGRRNGQIRLYFRGATDRTSKVKERETGNDSHISVWANALMGVMLFTKIEENRSGTHLGKKTKRFYFGEKQ